MDEVALVLRIILLRTPVELSQYRLRQSYISNVERNVVGAEMFVLRSRHWRRLWAGKVHVTYLESVSLAFVAQTFRLSAPRIAPIFPCQTIICVRTCFEGTYQRRKTTPSDGECGRSGVERLDSVREETETSGLRGARRWISTGSAVRLHGSWQSSVGNKQSHELRVARLQVMGENDAEGDPIQPKYQTPEYLRTISHLRPRIPFNALLLRLRSQVIWSITTFFNERDFIQTHTPVITSSDCEGAGEVFTVSTGAANDSSQHEKPANEAQAEHFFRAPKYLTVSAQLHLEALAQAVSKVWTLSPTFRAEKSDTPRHLSEFYMLEAEMCFVEDMKTVMDVVENMLRAVATNLESSKIGSELLEMRQIAADRVPDATEKQATAELLKQRWAGMSAPDWPRITYREAIDMLRRAVSETQISFEFQPSHEDGLHAEHERYLASSVGQGKPVFVTDYPLQQKPFYMASSSSKNRSEGGAETAACFDLLVPDLCEVVGGSMRESCHAALVDNMTAKGVAGTNLEWYQELRKYGSVPHGGFGLGFDRLLCYLAGVTNLRDVVAFPRWHGRCEC
nr:asparagine--trna ligase, mitochondrial [Quercus suber]